MSFLQLRSTPRPQLATVWQLNVSIAVAVLDLTFNLLAPTVTTTRNVTVSPDVVSATFSAITPTITVGDLVTPAPLESTFTLNAPVVRIGDSITADTVSATFTLLSPTIITENKTNKAQTIIVSSEVKPTAFLRDNNMSMLFARDNNKPKASMV